MSHTITLLTTPHCSLCTTARETIKDVTRKHTAEVHEIDITQDAKLQQKYSTQVPVVLVDGKPHDFWRVNPERLAAVLRQE
ncbi:MAG: glutaredoxin family protein [Micrococcaceae bacterium]